MPKPSAVAYDENSRTESFRVLRSNLEVIIAELDRRSIMIASANAHEGKTMTTVNLAYAIAGTGRRVVLVDLDLRHPDVHNHIDVHNEFGVTDVLLGRRPLADCLQFVDTTRQFNGAERGFYALTVGPPVENPSELLSTSRTGRMLESLTSQADIVLLDVPPVLPIADSLTIARVAGGVVLVVEAGRTTYPQAERAIQLLTRSQARTLGVVLNKARDGVGYGYGYGYAAVTPT